MTPAARLRAAADLIERTGAETTPGPWFADTLNERAEVWANYTETNGVPSKRWVADTRYGDINAAWIALLGPDTAPALAAMLRVEADAHADDGDAPAYCEWLPNALAFADLILRGQP